MSSRNIAAAESLKKVHQSCGGHLKFQLDKISLGRSKNKFWSACSSSSSSSRYFCCSSRCWRSWCSWWRWSESSRVEKPDFKGRKIKRVANYFLRRWNWFGVKHAKKENASHGNLVCVFGGGAGGVHSSELEYLKHYLPTNCPRGVRCVEPFAVFFLWQDSSLCTFGCVVYSSGS